MKNCDLEKIVIHVNRPWAHLNNTTTKNILARLLRTGRSDWDNFDIEPVRWSLGNLPLSTQFFFTLDNKSNSAMKIEGLISKRTHWTSKMSHSLARILTETPNSAHFGKICLSIRCMSASSLFEIDTHGFALIANWCAVSHQLFARFHWLWTIYKDTFLFCRWTYILWLDSNYAMYRRIRDRRRRKKTV